MESYENMDRRKDDMLEVKLDILIDDFQRYRTEQMKVNKELSLHASNETAVQASILSTQHWHTVIGGAVIAAFLWFYVYNYLPLVEEYKKHITIYNNNNEVHTLYKEDDKKEGTK